MMRRVGLLLLLTAAATLAGLVYFAHIGRESMLSGLSRWAVQQRRAGWVVEAQPATTITSWFIPEISLRNVQIQGGGDVIPGGLALTADRVDLRGDLANPTLVHLTVLGNVSLRVGSLTRITFASDRLLGTVAFGTPTLTQRSALQSIAIDGKNLHSTDGQDFGVGILNGRITLNDQGANLDLRTEAVAVPAATWGLGGTGLGDHLSDVTLDASLTGWPPSVGSRGARADIWRASGGAIDISHLVGGWGPLGLDGQAHLTLDQDLQPDITAKLQVRGYQALLQSWGDQAQLAAAVLAAASQDGAVTIDVRVKKNRLSLDRVGVARVPRTLW